MFTDAVVLPPVFEAVTVYLVAKAAAVGFPLMTPVAVLRFRPAGSVGLTL
jgi:hypothetical protein